MMDAEISDTQKKHLVEWKGPSHPLSTTTPKPKSILSLWFPQVYAKPH